MIFLFLLININIIRYRKGKGRFMKYLQTSLCYVPILVFLSFSACTGQLPGSFRLAQQEETFTSVQEQEVNTKIDLLWVVDNSPSMWPSQKKIREGFRLFAGRYMKPTWDIRMAVISQDTYLAHPSFANFLNSVAGTGSAARYSRSVGFNSSYLNPAGAANPKRSTPFVAPSFWGATTINASGTVTGAGIKLRHAIPEYGGADLSLDVSPTNPSQYARLVSGRHDGPLATLCWTSISNPFFFGITQCHVRDQQELYQGSDNCVNGGTGILDSSVQCVNTLMNNTVRSGKPIINTQPPEGVNGDSAWTEQLYRDFIVNLSGGVSGYPFEMVFNSINQLITDNEIASSNSRFFRAGSLRVIIIVTDEDDQSTVIPSSQITPDSQFNPNASCPYKTVDEHSYRLQICPKPEKLLAVPEFKGKLDGFFRNLNGNTEGDPNYFVVTITPTSGRILKDLHDEMGEDSNNYGAASSDIGTRLFEFADSVGNGSLRLEMTRPDYSQILDSIGQVIVEKKAVYVLQRAPTGQEDMIVSIRHADGTIQIIPPEDYTISDKTLTITNYNLILSLSSTDRVLINYQPKTVF